MTRINTYLFTIILVMFLSTFLVKATLWDSTNFSCNDYQYYETPVIGDRIIITDINGSNLIYYGGDGNNPGACTNSFHTEGYCDGVKFQNDGHAYAHNIYGNWGDMGVIPPSSTFNVTIQYCTVNGCAGDAYPAHAWPWGIWTSDYMKIPMYFDCPAFPGCLNITVPGTYKLGADIINTSADFCINISVSNVTLDCQGYMIDSNSSGICGILANPYPSGNLNLSNITVKNCIITDWDNGNGLEFNSTYGSTIYDNTISNNWNGLEFYDSSNNLVYNDVISNNVNSGFYLDSSSNNNIFTSNTANSNQVTGINLVSSSNNILTNNTANSNGGGSGGSSTGYGIHITYSSNNILTNNTANSNQHFGIWLDHSSNNILTNNTANSNQYGIYLDYSSNNTITRNIANLNSWAGIILYSYYWYSSNNNIIANNTANSNINGIELGYSPNNIITNNTFNSNYHGIQLDYSSSNIITNNTFNSNSYDGIYLEAASNNNTLTNNTANSNNYSGIELYYSSNNNLIYNNYFNNSVNARDTGNNFWNTTKTPGTNIIGGPYIGGNFWSDYAGVDTSNPPDGMGDTLLPYTSNGNIATGGDYLPLALAPAYGPWESIYLGSGNYPVIDIEEYNGKLYFVANNNNIYVFDGIGWNQIQAPPSVLLIQNYTDGKMYVTGSGGTIYSFDGSSFSPVFNTNGSYARMLGIYNGTLYAATYLSNPAKLYYCSGSCSNTASWHQDTAFSSILYCPAPFCSIDSMGVYNSMMYVGSGSRVYQYYGSNWSMIKNYPNVSSFQDMEVYNSKLYLATADSAQRCPLYQGYSGFCGRVIQYNGTSWSVAFDHIGYNTKEGYWMYSLGVYNGRLYAGTADRIYMYDGSAWNLTFDSSGPQYAMVLKNWTFNNITKIYVGFGNGVIAKDDMFEPLKIIPVSPQNTTYTTNSINLSFTTSRPTSWVGYSLDGKPNITMQGNTTLTNLEEKLHSLVIYAKDNVGFTNYSKVYFTVSIPKPATTCTCTTWEPAFICCSGRKEKWTRLCNPKGCQAESKCEGYCFV